MEYYDDEYEDDPEDDDTLLLDPEDWNYLAHLTERMDQERLQDAEVDEVVSQIRSLQNQIGRELTSREIGSLAAQIEATGSTDVGGLWDYMGGDRASPGASDDARIELFAELIDGGGEPEAPPAYWEPTEAQEQ